jgi:molybdopterin converting factor small subunit
MKVYLKCFANLVNPNTCNFDESTDYELENGQTVGDLVKLAGIAAEDVKVAFVNSKIVGLDKVLSDGDQIGLAPAVGGM